jgi:hypothetical protein
MMMMKRRKKLKLLLKMLRILLVGNLHSRKQKKCNCGERISWVASKGICSESMT